MKKIIHCFFLVFITSSIAFGQTKGSQQKNFLKFNGSEILHSVTDEKNGTGSALLTNNRLVYYKEWKNENHFGQEVTLIDTPYEISPEEDWFSEKYIESMILYLARSVLIAADNDIVKKTMKEKKYVKESGKNGEIVYSIPGSSYSEFFFVVRQPDSVFEHACIKLRYIMQL